MSYTQEDGELVVQELLIDSSNLFWKNGKIGELIKQVHIFPLIPNIAQILLLVLVLIIYLVTTEAYTSNTTQKEAKVLVKKLLRMNNFYSDLFHQLSPMPSFQEGTFIEKRNWRFQLVQIEERTLPNRTRKDVTVIGIHAVIQMHIRMRNLCSWLLKTMPQIQYQRRDMTRLNVAMACTGEYTTYWWEISWQRRLRKDTKEIYPKDVVWEGDHSL
jgi:hypothetical protein